MNDVIAPSAPGTERRPSASGRADWRSTVERAVGEVRRVGSIVWSRCRPVLATVTGTGWSVVVLSCVAWVLGSQLGWIELRVAAFAGAILFALCAVMTLGRTRVKINISVQPVRVVAGESAVGRMRVTNVGRSRLLPVLVEIPIGESAACFELPMLSPDMAHEELFVVRTARRGVIAVGPAITVRGDPLGLLRRTFAWTEVTDLYVHPVTVAIDALGSGLIRDLEGQTSEHISMSDLAFHALREYAPGDDRRHIHWRSSAKAASSGLDEKFLVKQFLDTRRSHLTVVVDGSAGAYLSDEDFETAASAGASLAVRAIRDGIDTTLLVADQATEGEEGQATLDHFAMAQLGQGDDLVVAAARAALMAPDTSFVVLITGANVEFASIRRAVSHFRPEVKAIAIRVDPRRPVGVTESSIVPVLELPHVGDLAPLVRGGGFA